LSLVRGRASRRSPEAIAQSTSRSSSRTDRKLFQDRQVSALTDPQRWTVWSEPTLSERQPAPAFAGNGGAARYATEYAPSPCLSCAAILEEPWGMCKLRVIMHLHSHYCTPNATLFADLGFFWYLQTTLPPNEKQTREDASRYAENIGTLRHRPRVCSAPLSSTSHFMCGSAVGLTVVRRSQESVLAPAFGVVNNVLSTTRS
jgi:hypothetical protein